MALVDPVFFDTNILVSGLLSIGSSGDSSQELLWAVAEGGIPRPVTSWHCCLEFYAVSTRLPVEMRLEPEVAADLLTTEVLERFLVLDLPPEQRSGFVRGLEAARISGGRVYDHHIAAIAQAAGVAVIVTNNRRHFQYLAATGIRVLTAEEAAQEI